MAYIYGSNIWQVGKWEVWGIGSVLACQAWQLHGTELNYSVPYLGGWVWDTTPGIYIYIYVTFETFVAILSKSVGPR